MSDLIIASEAVVLQTPSGNRTRQVSLEVVGAGSYSELTKIKVTSVRVSALTVQPKAGTFKQASLEVVASSLDKPPEPELYSVSEAIILQDVRQAIRNYDTHLEIVASSSEGGEVPALYSVSESVILQDLSQGPTATSVTLEIVGSSGANPLEPQVVKVDELVVLASTSGAIVQSASLEVVGLGDYDLRPVVSVKKMRVSALVATPKTTRALKASLEVVGLDPRVVQTTSFFALNESVILQDVSKGPRTSKASLEIVGESGIVPPSNEQQVVWFVTS